MVTEDVCSIFFCCVRSMCLMCVCKLASTFRVHAWVPPGEAKWKACPEKSHSFFNEAYQSSTTAPPERVKKRYFEFSFFAFRVVQKLGTKFFCSPDFQTKKLLKYGSTEKFSKTNESWLSQILIPLFGRVRLLPVTSWGLYKGFTAKFHPAERPNPYRRSQCPRQDGFWGQNPAFSLFVFFEKCLKRVEPVSKKFYFGFLQSQIFHFLFLENW